jgi:hypothetical protein
MKILKIRFGKDEMWQLSTDDNKEMNEKEK